MKTFIRFFVQNHLLANLLTLMVFLLGLNTLLGIKRDSYPNVDYGIITVTTAYPGASPENVEINVTNKIEKELKGVNGIQDMTSVSMENTSVIRVVIDPNLPNQEKVKKDVREAVNRVVDLPDDVEGAPLVEELNTSLIPVMEVGITGGDSYRQMRDYAQIIEKKLRSLPGVSRLERFDLRAREVQIEVAPQKMRAYDVSFGEMIQAIVQSNVRLTAGALENYPTEDNIVTQAEFRGPLEVGEVIVRATFDGPAVKIKDLAIVRDDFKKPTVLSRMNGEPAISFMVYKKEAADVIRTADSVKKMVARSAPTLPPGLKLTVATDYSHYVKNRFKVVLSNAWMGLILVVLILSVFLNRHAALWVAVGIPVSLLGTVFLMPKFGVYLDALSLSAMIMVLGMLADDGIVICENIYTNRQKGKSPVDACVDGVADVFWPVMAMHATTLCAFIPMFIMPGIFGKFVFVIPLVFCLTLVISALEVVIALPAHMVSSLKSPNQEYEKKWFERWQAVFRKFLRSCLPYRIQFFMGFLVLLGVSLWLAATKMNYVLLPSKMANEIYISMELPQGTTLEANARKVKEVEALVAVLPKNEIASYVTRIGEEWLDEIQIENYSYITISLTPTSQRRRSAEDIVADLRQKTDTLQGYRTITYFIETGGPPVGKPVHFYIVGPNDQTRESLTSQMVAFLNQTEGVKDVERGDKFGKNQIALEPNYERLARLGLSVADVAKNARIAVDGEIVTSVRYDNEDVDFRVLNDPASRQERDYLAEMLIPNREGQLIGLGQVVDFVKQPGYAHFQHYDGERATAVYGQVDKTKISPMEVKRLVEQRFNLDKDWPGTRIVNAGEVFETEKSIMSLKRTFWISVVANYFILVLLFKSFFQPLFVILAIPFGTIGVIWALYLHGEPLSFLGLLGAVGVSGVVGNDTLVLINHLNQLRKRKPDVPVEDIVVEGAGDRLRSTILTSSFTTLGGLLPLAYGWGGSDPFVTPMVLALGYGLAFATVLTLILMPCLYMLGDDVRKKFQGRYPQIPGSRKTQVPRGELPLEEGSVK